MSQCCRLLVFKNQVTCHFSLLVYHVFVYSYASGCGGTVVELLYHDQEVSWVRTPLVPDAVKLGSDCFFARARHLEVRITGLSDMILKTEAPCYSRCGTLKIDWLVVVLRPCQKLTYTSLSKIHLYGDVAIYIGEGLQNFYLFLALRAFEQRVTESLGFFSVSSERPTHSVASYGFSKVHHVPNLFFTIAPKLCEFQS
jgi:hypothetical protein